MRPNGIEPGFARFVYCLGYGEPQLVSPRITQNGGTPQYWRLFHDTVRDPQLMVVGVLDWRQRVKNKVALLMKMQRAGIWLIDASVTALYRQGVRLVTGADYRAVPKACWECYIGQVLCGCTPSAVLIVGRGVGSVIEDAVRQEFNVPIVF
jgi:hypothetical protein